MYHADVKGVPIGPEVFVNNMGLEERHFTGSLMLKSAKGEGNACTFTVSEL